MLEERLRRAAEAIKANLNGWGDAIIADLLLDAAERIVWQGDQIMALRAELSEQTALTIQLTEQSA